MKPSPLLLCAVALACSLAVWAFSRWMEEPEQNNLSSGVESRHASENRRTGENWTHRAPARLAQDSGSSAPPAQSINPDAKRIITELVENGMTQEEAGQHFKRVSEIARIERSTRLPMPGVRTNVDVKRFPLFEE